MNSLVLFQLFWLIYAKSVLEKLDLCERVQLQIYITLNANITFPRYSKLNHYSYIHFFHRLCKSVHRVQRQQLNIGFVSLAPFVHNCFPHVGQIYRLLSNNRGSSNRRSLKKCQEIVLKIILSTEKSRKFNCRKFKNLIIW